MQHTDVAIVGGGPIGLELHAALKHAGAAALHYEAGAIGHTFAWWAPGTKFFSSPERLAICGVPLSTPDQGKIPGEDYRRYLLDVTQQFDLNIRTFEQVTHISRDGDGFILRSRRSEDGVGGKGEPAALFGDERECHAKHVVLAIGNMHRARLINCPGEDLPHVSHYLEEVERYFGRRVVIVGGKNSAVEAAIRLYRAGADVTICYRQPAFDEKRIKYWLLPELEWLIEKGQIGFMPGTCVTRVTPEAVELDSGESLLADDVLMLTGYVQDKSLFEQLGVELMGEIQRPIFNHDTMETTAEGVYVAGTACGGSQNRARVFIENSHIHTDRICRAITGQGVFWEMNEVLGVIGQESEEQ